MISVALLFLWLKNIGHTGPTISPCKTPLWKLPPLRFSIFWHVFINKFINYCLCPLRKHSILEPVLCHETKNTSQLAHLYCHYQKLHCCYAKNIPYEAVRCALSQSCWLLPKARVLPEAELFEGLEPLLFSTYKEYGKWINRLSQKTEHVKKNWNIDIEKVNLKYTASGFCFRVFVDCSGFDFLWFCLFVCSFCFVGGFFCFFFSFFVLKNLSNWSKSQFVLK